MAVQMIIDGDGHVLEDYEAIASKAPPEWGNPGLTRRNLFPELDHVHNALRTTPPGSFLPAPVDRWIEFQDARKQRLFSNETNFWDSGDLAGTSTNYYRS